MNILLYRTKKEMSFFFSHTNDLKSFAVSTSTFKFLGINRLELYIYCIREHLQLFKALNKAHCFSL